MVIADINTESRALCDADSTSYADALLLIRTNYNLEKVISWILESDGRWEWDDTNYTTKPRGVGTLVEGQEAYSFASEYLTIRQIEVLDTSSPAVFVKLKPIQDLELNGMSPEEYFGLESDGSPKKGFPQYYDKEGDTITLYPAPAATDVTLASGLRVWFQRTADLFTSAQVTTGTKEPGFASPFHSILCYMNAIPYCMSYKKDRVAAYSQVVGDFPQPSGMKKQIMDFYGHRAKDERHIMTPKRIQYI